jgi:hypothetical protein
MIVSNKKLNKNGVFRDLGGLVGEQCQGHRAGQHVQQQGGSVCVPNIADESENRRKLHIGLHSVVSSPVGSEFRHSYTFLMIPLHVARGPCCYSSTQSCNGHSSIFRTTWPVFLSKD